MRDRNLLCKYYIRAGKCKKGKGCTAFGEMQHCGLYKPDLNGKPIRVDKRKSKLEKIRKKRKVLQD